MAKRPPHLRTAVGAQRCGNCAHFDGAGHCKLYDYGVARSQVCDSYMAAGGNMSQFDQAEYDLQLAAARARRGLNLAVFEESKHPRLHGRFAKLAAHLASMPSGTSHTLPDGTRIEKSGMVHGLGMADKYRVHQPGETNMRVHGKGVFLLGQEHEAAAYALGSAQPMPGDPMSSVTSGSTITRDFSEGDLVHTPKGPGRVTAVARPEGIRPRDVRVEVGNSFHTFKQHELRGRAEPGDSSSVVGGSTIKHDFNNPAHRERIVATMPHADRNRYRTIEQRLATEKHVGRSKALKQQRDALLRKHAF